MLNIINFEVEFYHTQKDQNSRVIIAKKALGIQKLLTKLWFKINKVYYGTVHLNHEI